MHERRLQEAADRSIDRLRTLQLDEVRGDGDHHRLRAGDELGDVLVVLAQKHRVALAGDHQRRHAHLFELRRTGPGVHRLVVQAAQRADLIGEERQMKAITGEGIDAIWHAHQQARARLDLEARRHADQHQPTDLVWVA